MTGAGWRLLLAATPAFGGAAIALSLRDHPEACRGSVLATGAYAVGMILLWIRRRTADAAPAATPRPGERLDPLAQLRAIERSVALSQSSALEFEHRVQPQLRRTAAERLRLRHAVDLDRDPDSARSLLGEPAWRLITTRHPGDDRTSRAPSIDVILQAIARLEEV
jgi:hypothetical protein